MEDRGTLSIEFLFTSMIMVLICSGMVSIVSDRLDMASNTEELYEARMLIESVASSINEVYAAGNGQSKEFSLPQAVGNSSYSILVNSSGVYIEFSGMIGKADLYPMVIINGYSNNSHTIELTPGKSYCIKNTLVENKSIITIYSK